LLLLDFPVSQSQVREARNGLVTRRGRIGRVSVKAKCCVNYNTPSGSKGVLDDGDGGFRVDEARGDDDPDEEEGA
jgi:hypothetical protein